MSKRMKGEADMEENQRATGAAFRDDGRAEVRIALEKKAGETVFTRSIEASDARAALNGLAVLIVEYAKAVGIEAMKALSLLAVSLAVPALREESRGHWETGD